MKELGIPVRKSDRPIARDVQQYYPLGTIVESKKVR